MKNRRSLFVLSILLGMSTGINGQMLKEKAVVYAVGERETPFLEFKKPHEVYTGSESQAWYRLHLSLLVFTSDLDENTLIKGAEVRNAEGEIIGKTTQDISIRAQKKPKGRKFKEFTLVSIEADAYRTQFERKSIPEERVESLFSSGKKGMLSRMIEELIEEWELKAEDVGDFTVYPLYREHYDLEDKQDFKILFIFKKGGSFYSLVSNDITFNIDSKLESHDPPFHIYFPTIKASDRDQKAIYELLFSFTRL